MYGVSSVQFAHQWFKVQPEFTERKIRVSGKYDDGRALAREFMDHHGLYGELQQIRKTENGFALRLVRPARIDEIEYSAATGEAKIRSGNPPAMGVLVRIHHITGHWRQTGLMNFWGLVLGVVSTALIVLGATGIYLWFKRKGRAPRRQAVEEHRSVPAAGAVRFARVP
ncbi:MAG: hypothetical protein HY235_03995 [Acidobacteria bacterium]|nr:hypothetical protein [Acidobacteriota bacterium]